MCDHSFIIHEGSGGFRNILDFHLVIFCCLNCEDFIVSPFIIGHVMFCACQVLSMSVFILVSFCHPPPNTEVSCYRSVLLVVLRHIYLAIIMCKFSCMFLPVSHHILYLVFFFINSYFICWLYILFSLVNVQVWNYLHRTMHLWFVFSELCHFNLGSF